MLQAKIKDGTFVTLATKTRQEISLLRTRETFFCPVCSQPVIAKAGTKVIPHFAHEAKTDCPSQEGGEGSYHEKGKLLLYQWLKKQGLDVRLEFYISEIMQRPDILLQLNHRMIAIEYQCARIPTELIAERSRGYYRAGIIPIWILGANTFRRHGRQQLKVDSFHLPFIHQFSAEFPRTLYFFCPETHQVLFFQDIYFTTLRTITGNLSIRKLEKMIFTDLFPVFRFTQQELFHIWQQKKRTFRLYTPGRLYGREMVWQQWLYTRRANRQTLPSPIYLPISSQHLMKTPPWDWQSRLFLDIITPLEAGSAFSYQICIHMLRNHFHAPSLFPLMLESENPIREYFYLLEILQLIRKTSADHYIKQNEWSFYDHIEEALDGDARMIEQIMKQNGGMIHG
ncbi:competence protein CoiA family protein [Lentibacillus halophilus]|uniref:Competence protein CoiA family protein n=1 Tax=Lentibacillus halophilus TaxID=295065 RepID=A0ABN0Z4D0_9BACI